MCNTQCSSLPARIGAPSQVQGALSFSAVTQSPRVTQTERVPTTHLGCIPPHCLGPFTQNPGSEGKHGLVNSATDTWVTQSHGTRERAVSTESCFRPVPKLEGPPRAGLPGMWAGDAGDRQPPGPPRGEPES